MLNVDMVESVICTSIHALTLHNDELTPIFKVERVLQQNHGHEPAATKSRWLTRARNTSPCEGIIVHVVPAPPIARPTSDIVVHHASSFMGKAGGRLTEKARRRASCWNSHVEIHRTSIQSRSRREPAAKPLGGNGGGRKRRTACYEINVYVVQAIHLLKPSRALRRANRSRKLMQHSDPAVSNFHLLRSIDAGSLHRQSRPVG